MILSDVPEPVIVFANQSPNIMNYSVNPRTADVPSVRRRNFGPYKPCPRAKRLALMEKQDSKSAPITSQNDTLVHKTVNEDADNNTATEESIDFAVESSETGIPIIELDDDVEDVSLEDISSNMEEDENEGRSLEDIASNIEMNLVEENAHTELLLTQQPTVSHEDSEQTTENVEQRPIDLSNLNNSPGEILDIDKETTFPQQTSKTKLSNCLSPHVRLKRSNEINNFVPMQQVKTYKTYMSYGYELRQFDIILKDCHHVTKTLTKTSSIVDLEKEKKNMKSPTSKYNIRTVSTAASSADYIEKYEDTVARKLQFLRRRLQAKVCTDSNRIEQAPHKENIITAAPMTNLSIDTTMEAPILQEERGKHPVHPRTRLRLSPIKTPTSVLSDLKYAIRKSLSNNIVELSDSDTESQDSVMSVSEAGYGKSERIKIEDDEESVAMTVDESESDERMDISDDSIKSEPSIKTEIKTEEPTCDSKSYYIESDEELLTDILNACNHIERRRRKVSSNKRVQSYVTMNSEQNRSAQPSLIKLSPTKSPTRKFPPPIVRQISTSSSTSTDADTESDISPQIHLRKPNFRIDVVLLSTQTVENLIQLCTNTREWNDNSLLEKAGMSLYDINRLGILTSARQKANYGLRQFVKKNKAFQSQVSIEKPKTTSSSSASRGEKKIDNKALKALRHKKKVKERQERKQRDKDSIRRALLRINGRLMNQNRFWAFINRGLSQDDPILL